MFPPKYALVCVATPSLGFRRQSDRRPNRVSCPHAANDPMLPRSATLFARCSSFARHFHTIVARRRPGRQRERFLRPWDREYETRSAERGHLQVDAAAGEYSSLNPLERRCSTNRVMAREGEVRPCGRVTIANDEALRRTTPRLRPRRARQPGRYDPGRCSHSRSARRLSEIERRRSVSHKRRAPRSRSYATLRRRAIALRPPGGSGTETPADRPRAIAPVGSRRHGQTPSGPEPSGAEFRAHVAVVTLRGRPASTARTPPSDIPCRR